MAQTQLPGQNSLENLIRPWTASKIGKMQWIGDIQLVTRPAEWSNSVGAQRLLSVVWQLGGMDTAHTEEIVTMTTATIDEPRTRKEISTAHIMCFSATESRCSQVTDELVADLEETFPGRITVENVDVWDNPQLAVDHGVLTLPTVIVTIDGQERLRVAGLNSRRQFLKKMDRVGFAI